MSLLLLGTGGLGSAAALALAGAGIAELGVVDGDRVSLSNLHRQILFDMGDIGREKVVAARDKIMARSPGTALTPYPQRLEGVAALLPLFSRYRVVLDGTDNALTRFAANEAALQCGVPLVHGAAIGWRGQVMTILPGESACLRCLFPHHSGEEQGGCARDGVVGPLVEEVGWLMALEAIKLLSGQGEPLTNGLLTIDLLRNKRRWVPFRRQPDCPGCGGATMAEKKGSSGPGPAQ